MALPRSQRGHVTRSSIAKPLINEIPPTSPPKNGHRLGRWRDLPNKSQLILLLMIRFAEPLAYSSSQSYRFFQLRYFDPSLSDAVIADQLGWMAAVFSFSQLCTAFLWCRAADSKHLGRKKILLIGLVGNLISMLGLGFSSSFRMALVFRTLGGIFTGNVGVMRVMVSEMYEEPSLRARAFALLPFAFNIASILGPVIGGVLSDPAHQYPSIFGLQSFSGGVQWMAEWPYAFPNVVISIFLLISLVASFFLMDETLPELRGQQDVGKEMWHKIKCALHLENSTSWTTSYLSVSSNDTDEVEACSLIPASAPPPKRTQRLPFRQIWTRNLTLTMIAHALAGMHICSFNNLWFTLLSTSRFDPTNPQPLSHTSQHLPFNFTGGLALTPTTIAVVLSILGAVGIGIQLLYPRAAAALGTTRCFQLSLVVFPIAYFLAPYLVLLPSSTSAPAPASGSMVWLGTGLVLLVFTVGRVFGLPALTILINNSSPHPSALSSVHGIAQSIWSGSRMIGVAVAGWAYGQGLEVGVVGVAWWGMAGVAVLGLVVAQYVRDGSAAPEIVLDDEEEDESGSETEEKGMGFEIGDGEEEEGEEFNMSGDEKDEGRG